MKRDNFRLMKASIVATILILLFASPALAQTGSLAVFENCADGELINNWVENASIQWNPQNESGDCRYEWNCTGSEDGYGTTINETTGHRWFGYTEVQSNDTSILTGPIIAYNNSEDYLCILMNQSAETIYICHYNGSFTYYDATNDTWSTNMSNVTNYDTEDEQWYWEYASDYCSMKWLYNRYNGSINFKAWTGAAMSYTEPTSWLIDVNSDLFKYSSDVSEGLVAADEMDEAAEVYFRRIMFWNLTYELDETSGKPLISVPLYSAVTFFDEMGEMFEYADSFYNATTAVINFFNMFDLESWMEYPAEVDESAYDQNDTVYVFSLMLTQFKAFVEDVWGDEAAYFAPDNLLFIAVEACTDGSDDDGDYCLIQFDSDQDGDYEDWEKSYMISGNYSSDTATSYTGIVADEEPTFYVLGDKQNSSDNIIMHRFASYAWYLFLINPDYILTSDGGDPIDVDDYVNISIVIGDYNGTKVPADIQVWQGWNETTCDLNHSYGNSSAEFLSGLANITTEDNWGLLWLDPEGGDEDHLYDPYVAPTVSIDIDAVMVMVNVVVQVAVIFLFLGAALSQIRKIKF